MDLSIIICTYNGENKLPLTLESISRAALPEDSCTELIVIDNNSSDSTKSVIANFSHKSSFPVKYFFEPKKGLSNARNLGLKEALGDIIIFTDDDCIVDRNWLMEIFAEFQSDPNLMVLGGRVELYNHKDKPVTLYPLTQRRKFTSSSQIFVLLPGCNMSFRKSVFRDIGKFDINFGAGKKIPSAEDSDFFYRAFRKNFKMVYSPDVLIYHNHGRRNDGEVKKLLKGYVIGQGAFYCKYILKKDGVVFHLCCRVLINNTKLIIKNILTWKSIRQVVSNCFYLFTGMAYYLKVRRKAEG
jgi:glycosyltransferase involved in cell wall biosynthesis